MNFKLNYLIANIIVILVLTIQTANSIKCWNCWSESDKHCLDPFDNSTMAVSDCAVVRSESHPGREPTLCQKIHTKENGVWVTYRKCAFVGEPGTEGKLPSYFKKTGEDGAVLEYYTCNDKHVCNDSNRVGLTMWLMTIMTVVLIVKVA